MLIRLGTRQSALALWQAEHITSRLQSFGVDVELVKITTAGDVSTTPLNQSGGQGVFTKEIQRALLDNRCDLAVHSLKDLPTEIVPGLMLTAVPPREDPADCLISKANLQLDKLARGARIGTGSPRRKAQLLHARPDLDVQDIRGNVDTRLRKLDEGQFDAILLAYAGLTRLQLSDRISQKLSFETMLPAVGQAALGLETRSDDLKTIEAIHALDDTVTHACVLAERNVLRSMRAGCLAPLAANAMIDSKTLHLIAKVFSSDGQEVVAAELRQSFDASMDRVELYSLAEQFGAEVANKLIKLGASRLIPPRIQQS